MKTEKKVMDNFTACSIAEGFCGGEDATDQERLEAWAYLIKTGQCWSLQGWYGRNAQSLIERGIISKTGDILISAEELEA